MDDTELKRFRGKDWAILESEKLGAFGERLSFVEQHTPEGFGHAVYQARQWVGDEPFLLLLGDHVYISDIKDRCARQLIKVEQYMLDARRRCSRRWNGCAPVRRHPGDADRHGPRDL
jgi:UTP-glucose-1-phosphate uridylyltransferase